MARPRTEAADSIDDLDASQPRVTIQKRQYNATLAAATGKAELGLK